jgi:MSHA biogenesis protein MshJ
MNERLRQQLNKAVKNIDSRSRSEKVVGLVVLLAGLFMVYLSASFDPLRADITSMQNQIASVNQQIAAQRSSYASMVAASQEDPNKFANERLAVIAREQAQLSSEISNLAGDLISPADMTRILTSLLERQAGLELIRFENKNAVPLRGGPANEGVQAANDLSGQVFSHGLVIEFQGDFFATLKYLRFLEGISESFFWDSIDFKQVAWPDALVTLEIHTLSSNAGFIGA